MSGSIGISFLSLLIAGGSFGNRLIVVEVCEKRLPGAATAIPSQ
jgi:hypothetical protein